MLLGADIGGTFTDLVWWDGQTLRTAKLPSTPAEPERALLAGMDALGARGPRPGVHRTPLLLIHGSTVATNAFLERRGARVVFVTTAGFGDALEIGRQQRSAIYDIRAARPAPLVPSERRVEVHERLDAAGAPLVPLDEAEVSRVVAEVAALRPEAVAICLLHSYANPAHERRLAEALRDVCPFVYASYLIDPAYREYERMSTTAINAYVAPRVAAYVARLRDQLAEIAQEKDADANKDKDDGAGVRQTPLRLMGAHGGREPGGTLERPASMILSGPAGGVVGAAAIARAAGVGDVITLDMGGTSTDVALIAGGAPLLTRETLLEGLPLRALMLDLATIGAGGGSIARFDRGGALRVGPQSAGAQPGPACYGRGGTSFTVTDAHLLLGHLLPEAFLGGRMALDESAARAAAEMTLAASGGQVASVTELAAGTLAVANAAMERAIRSVSARKGYDPADFWLLSFGGAGGLHAAELARALGMRGVLVPRLAGVLSALGMALADTQVAERESVLAPLATLDEAALERQLARMEGACRTRLLADGHAAEALRVERAVELRYVGQSYELTLPWQGQGQGQGGRAALADAFHSAHERRFGYADPTRSIEVVNAAVTAHALNAGFALPEAPSGPPAAPVRTVGAWFDGIAQPAAVYRFEALAQGQEIAGPAILAGEHATALVPPGAAARVDRYGNARITR